MFGRLFVLELKKNLRQLPFVCIAGALLAFFVGGLVSFAVKLYENNTRLLDVRMAVVSESPDDPYLDMLLGYVSAVSESSEDYTFSLSGSNYEKDRELVMYSKHMTLTLKMMEKEQALEELKDGTSLAILYMPENLTRDILVGNDTSVRIELGDVNALDALMISELSGALSNLLCSAQADDYAIAELYEGLGIPEETNDACIRMDMINGIHVAQRGFIYDTRMVTPAGLAGSDSAEGQMLIFFASCGVILLLFFSYVGFSPALTAESPEFYEILFARRMTLGSVRYILCKFAANLCVSGLFLTLLWSIASIICSGRDLEYLPSYGTGLLLLWITAALTDAISVFLFMTLRSAPAAILTFFCTITGMCFLSGYFIPSAFLPSALGKAGSVLPTASLLELWNRAVGFPAENTTGILLLWIVVFLILASVFCKKERRSAA